MNLRPLFAVFFWLGVVHHSIGQQKVTLEDAISIALQKNYDIRLEQNAAATAATDNRFVSGGFLPQLNATGSKVWNSNDQKQELAPLPPATENTIREKSGIKSDNLSGSIQLSWVLFDGTKMFATRKRIAQIEELGELTVRDQMVNTVATIINNYYDVVRQKQQLKAIIEQMSVSEERVKLAERRLQVGMGGKPELLQARVDLNAQRTAALLQETLIAQLKDRLNGLLAMGLPDQYDVGDTIPIDLGLIQDEIIPNIENTNTTLQVAKKNIEIAGLSLRERRMERSPVVTFNSAYNFSRTQNPVAINPFTPLYNQNQGYNYGFLVTLPILNGFNNTRLVRQADITVRRQQLLYDQQKTNTTIGVRNAFVSYENARKTLLIEEENILLAKENVFIALEGFRRGVITFIELRTAQQSLADAYNRLIAARYNAKLSETELLRLKGALLR